MADIDQIIAGGAGAGTTADFSGIPKLLDYFYKSKDEAAKNDLRDAFKDGVPMKDGQIDIPTIAKTLFQKGDVAGGAALLGQAQSAGERALYAGGGEPGQRAPIVSPPSANRPAQAVVAPPLNKGGVQGPGQSPQGDQPGSIVGLVSAAGIPDELAGPVIAQVSALTKMDPNAALDPNISQRVQQVVQAAAQRMKGGQQPQPSGLASQQPSPQQQPQIAQAQPQGLQPSPAQIAAQNDPELKRARFMAASPDKNVAEAGRAELKTIIESRAPTNPMKEAASQGLTLQQAQERAGEQAATQAGAAELAKTQVGEQQAIIAQGRQAGVRLGTANLMTNIIQSDKNLDLGFGSQTTLKIKMALERVGIDTGDLSGAQLLQKYNSILAAESTKGVTSRGTNFDMKTFMTNNPGLGMDEKGNIRMLSILSQNAKREYELGKLVPKNRENWDNWDNVVEAYDKKFPIKDPTTGRILSNNSIIAPGPTKGATPASGNAQAAPAAFPNAKQAPDGNWYVPDPARPGKYSRVIQ